MLELPESTNLSRHLNETVTGLTIVSAKANHSPHSFTWYEGDPASYSEALPGRALEGAVTRGGRVDLLLGGGLRLSLMDGVNLRLLTADAPRPAKHQLLLELSDGRALSATVQMYGGIMLYPRDEDMNFYDAVARQSPSPLTDAFDRAHFDGLVGAAKPTLSAKALLATEQRIPGLGNGCCQDILFIAGIHPQSHIGALSSTQMAGLYTSVKETLAQMAALGGRDTEKDLHGRAGGYKTLLSAKTLAAPCPKCGGAIVRKAYLGGNVYFCPTCQPLQK